MTRPAGKAASMKVKTTGSAMNIFAWIGSGGAGLSFCCTNMVMPMMTGQAPIASRLGGSHGMSPNRLKSEVGSGAERSWIQP
jgi:hypothetical protein